MNMTFTQTDPIKVQQEQHKEAGSKKYNMQENMREAFLQSQRTQSLQYIKGKDRRKRKYRGTKKIENKPLKRCLTEKRTEGHNSIVSEVPFFFKSLVT